VIDVKFHERDVHTLDWLVVCITPPPTLSGGILVGVNDEEGGNVHTITSDGQNQGVTEQIARLFYHRIVPKYENRWDENEGKEWNRDMKRAKSKEYRSRDKLKVWREVAQKDKGEIMYQPAKW